MRLKTSKSKNTTIFYIIKDYTKNGKRSTKIVKRIGNLSDIKIMAGNTDYNVWLKEYIKKYNDEHSKSETVIIKKNNKKLIPMNNRVSFNVGYLFLKKIYNQLKINDICKAIQDKYKFQFDLNEILSYLIYARIIYPSSKLETFKQCKNFIEQPNFKLHDEYRALSYIAENSDFIQEQLYNNRKILSKEIQVLFIMIVLITSLKSTMKMILENMAFQKNIDLTLLLVWDYLWMVMDYLFLLIFILAIKMSKKH